MKKSLISGVAGLVLGATIAGAIASQDPATQDPMAVMEANFAKYMEVTEHHRDLAKRAGKWHVKGEFATAPGAPMETMEGSSESEMVFDGRYLLESFSGKMPDSMGGEMFEGRGLSGYDNFKEKYIGAWFDSMSTGLYISEGARKGDMIVSHGEGPDFMTGGFKKTKATEKWLDDNTRVMEMFDIGPNGEEIMTMRLTYTRASGSSR